jgi:hypothetical protein
MSEIGCECAGKHSALREAGQYSHTSGHLVACPVHRRIMADYGYGPPPPPEDRGTPHWVWVLGGTARFERFDGAVLLVELSVPIGWRLSPDVGSGVALAGVFGDRLTAAQAWGMAAAGAGGFRVRSTARLAGGDGRILAWEPADAADWPRGDNP